VRITIVVPLLEVSGGARIIAGHAERLAARGHSVTIVAPQPGRPSIKDRAKSLLGLRQPVRSHHHANVVLANVRLHVPKRPGPIRQEDVPDADVIVATWWETVEWIWPMGPEKGAKVHFIQGYDDPPEDVGDRVERVWRLPTFKIAIAQWLADAGRDRFAIPSMELVPNSIDHQLFTAQPRSKGEPPRIGFLFHTAALKDLPTTLAAVARVKEARPDVRLVSFGVVMPQPGELPADCEFHCLPSQQQIADVYARCDVWLSTSKTEGFNLPPLEAMASGCPAVCSRTGRPLEIIEDGVNGYLVDAGDVEGFANAVLRILSLPNARWKRMSEAAQRSVAHPTWDESSELFERALMRAL
jgi:glycosyltransferase involved in cell wall biosynthesis